MNKYDDCIKITNKRSQKEAALYQTFYNLPVSEQTIQKKEKPKTTKNTVTFNIENNQKPAIERLLATNEMIIDQNNQLKEVISQRNTGNGPEPFDDVRKQDQANQLIVLREILDSTVKPFIEEIKQIRGEIVTLKEKDTQEKVNFENKIEDLNKTYHKLKVNLQEKKEEIKKNVKENKTAEEVKELEMGAQIKYKTLLEDFDAKIELIGSKLKDLDSRNREIIDIKKKEAKQEANDELQRLQSLYSIKFSTNINDFDYKTFIHDMTDLRCELQNARLNYNNDVLAFEIKPGTVPKSKPSKKNEKPTDILSILKNKFGDLYNQMVKTYTQSLQKPLIKKVSQRNTTKSSNNQNIYTAPTKPIEIPKDIQFVRIQKRAPIIKEEKFMRAKKIEATDKKTNTVGKEKIDQERVTVPNKQYSIVNNEVMLIKKDYASSKIQHDSVEQDMKQFEISNSNGNMDKSRKDLQIENEERNASKPLISEQNYTFTLKNDANNIVESNTNYVVNNNSSKESYKDYTGVREFINRDAFNQMLKEIVVDKFQETKAKLMPISEKSAVYPFRGAFDKNKDIQVDYNIKTSKNPLFEDDDSLNISKRSDISYKHGEEQQLLINMDEIISISRSITEMPPNKSK